MVGAVFAGEPAPWPRDVEGLPAAPEWKFGRLDNGLRYALRRNALPAGHVSLRLAVEVGFMHETPAEAGLAHFVEHMVFNGTKRYPGDTLVPEMQRHGIALGPELSAFTFMTYTLYQIDAPSCAPPDLARWLGVLRDFADGATFDNREVRQERKVVASELRNRESLSTRAEKTRRRFLYPQSPIGSAADGDVNKVDRASLVKFYDKWYRPERMLLIAVGDADPADLERALKDEFASLRGRGPAPSVQVGKIGNPPSGQIMARHDPHAGVAAMEVNSVLIRADADSLDDRRRWTARYLALGILNRRLANLQRKHHGRLMEISARSMFVTPFSLETAVTVQTPPDDWPFGVETLEQELRRSLEYTFTPAEIREACETLIATHEQAVASAPTRPSDQLATQAVASLLWDFVLTSPETELARLRADIEQLTAVDISHAWRSLWEQGRASVFAYGFFPARDAANLLNAAYQASAATPIFAPQNESLGEFAYQEFGPAGEVTSRTYDAAIDLHLIEFSNGVRLNLKRTSHEAGLVHVVTTFGRGMLTEPVNRPGLGLVLSGAFLGGGLGRHKPEELARLWSARSIQLQFAVEEDAFAFRGQSGTRDLPHALQAMAAYLTDPAWDEDAFSRASTAYVRQAQSQAYSPEGILSLHVYRTLAGGDNRYSLASPYEFLACRATDAREWLEPELRAAPLEIGLIGDLDIEETIAAVGRTLGALPARTGRGSEPRVPRFVKTLGPAPRELHFFGEATRAGTQVLWPLQQCSDIAQSRRLEVLSEILEDRLRRKIREELGSAYVPVVDFWKSEASPDDGYFVAYLSVKPKEAAKHAKLLRKLAHELALHGATADEFQKAREPLLARCVADLQSNGYWVRHIIAHAQSQPEVRTWPLTRERDLRAMTVEAVNATAREFLRDERAIVFTAVPSPN